MKKLLVLISLVAVLAVSCGQSLSNDTASHDTALATMLSTVPSDLAAGNLLYFSDMEKIKDLAGVGQDIDATGFINKTIAKDVYDLRTDLLAGWVASDFSGESHLDLWRDSFGFDAINTYQEIWGASLTPPNSFHSLFSTMRGNFASGNVIDKLKNLGYQLKTYKSVDYYSIRQDNAIGDIKSSTSQLARAFLNRVMVNEKEIIAAPADNTLFTILDVRSSQQNSLTSSLAYTRVAGSLGDILGAIFIPPSQLRSVNINKDWGKLHRFDLAGIGYRMEGQKPEMLIVLHYPDKSASDDISEISRRLAGYSVTTGSLKTPLLSDLFDIGTPEAAISGEDSILKIVLAYKTSTPRTLWYDLVSSMDLGFLVSD